MTMWRDRLTTALELVGFALMTVAAFLVSVPFGFAVAAAAFIGTGYLIGRNKS